MMLSNIIIFLCFCISLSSAAAKPTDAQKIQKSVVTFSQLYDKLTNKTGDFLDRLDFITKEAVDFVFKTAAMMDLVMENKNLTTPELNEFFERINPTKREKSNFNLFDKNIFNEYIETSDHLHRIGSDYLYIVTFQISSFKWYLTRYFDTDVEDCLKIPGSLKHIEEILVNECIASEEEYRTQVENYVHRMKFFRKFEYKFDRPKPKIYDFSESYRSHKFDILSTISQKNKTDANKTIQNLYGIINNPKNSHQTHKAILNLLLKEIKVYENWIPKKIKKCYTSAVLEAKTFKYLDAYGEFEGLLKDFLDATIVVSICSAKNHQNDTKVMEQELLAIINKTKLITKFTAEYLRNKFELAWELGVMEEVTKNILIDHDFASMKNRTNAAKKIQAELQIRGNPIWNYQVIISDASTSQKNSYVICKNDSCFAIEIYQNLNIYVGRFKSDSLIRAKFANEWLHKRQENITNILSIYYDQPLPFIASQLSTLLNETLVDETRFKTFIILRNSAFFLKFAEININIGRKMNIDRFLAVGSSKFFINPLFSRAYNILIYWIL